MPATPRARTTPRLVSQVQVEPTISSRHTKLDSAQPGLLATPDRAIASAATGATSATTAAARRDQSGTVEDSRTVGPLCRAPLIQDLLRHLWRSAAPPAAIHADRMMWRTVWRD
jgi:hypothetical protein